MMHKATNQKRNKTRVVRWDSESMRGLTKLKKRYASLSDKKKRVSVENKKTLKELEMKMKKKIMIKNM